MDVLLEQFLSEARDNLAYIDLNLKNIANGKDSDINALFRAAHTLKGGAGLVGFTSVKEVTHVAEDLLDALRQKKVEYIPSMLDALHTAFDEVVELVDAAEAVGSVDVDFDEVRVGDIMHAVGVFVPKTSKAMSSSGYTPIFMMSDKTSVGAFSDKQLEKMCALAIDSVGELKEEFFKEDNYWVVDLDLDVETVRLGNDPFYMFYLLGSDSIISVATEQYQCDKMDYLDWKTRIVALIHSNEASIEDAFYNVLDEAVFHPFTLESIFQTNLESMQNEAYDDFMDDIKINGIDSVKNGIVGILEVLNPKSKEHFVLSRLKPLINQSGHQKYIKCALSLLGVDLTIQNNSLSSVEIQNAVKILLVQKSILKAPGSLIRTKIVLENILKFLSISTNLDVIKSEEELVLLIDDVLKKINSNSVQDNSSNQSKSIETIDSVDSSVSVDVDGYGDGAKDIQTKKDSSAIVKTIKIDQEEIDYLMDIVGEILVIKNSIPYIAQQLSEDNIQQSRRELISKYEEISRITDQLQDRVMDMRLLPISYIFNRYPKLIRDISKKLGKNIEYIEYGGETKLDKMMIEKIADPLVHIIRNSLDHGIENEQSRVAAGKDSKGKLKVGARSEGDRVFIEIEDDGQGINTDSVCMKALEKGLIDPDILDSMDIQEKMKLIFLPGLSTKDVISDLSGRGVGADAVRSVVEELGGHIHLESELGKYTKTTLEIPVSVALTNVFHLLLGGVNYAVSMESVLETEKISKDKIKTASQRPFVSIRGEIVPIVLHESLLNRDEFKSEENLLIVRTKFGKIAIVVDEFVGQLNVVQKPLTGTLRAHPFINGVSLLGDGSPLLILNIQAMIKS